MNILETKPSKEKSGELFDGMLQWWFPRQIRIFLELEDIYLHTHRQQACTKLASITFSKVLQTMPNATPPMKNMCFWSSGGKDVHGFGTRFPRQIPEPTFDWLFLDLGWSWGSILGPLGWLFCAAFFNHIFIEVFFRYIVIFYFLIIVRCRSLFVFIVRS